MKKLGIVISLVFLVGLLGSFAVSDGEPVVKELVKEGKALVWYDDFQEANKIAERDGKTIFAFFTGSDWCGWCKKLQRDVFAKKEFIEWANKNVVLLELDFPRRTKLAPNIAKQNQELASVFKVRGYPTVWMFNAVQNPTTKQVNLNTYGSLGYPRGEKGKEQIAFIKNANLILAKKSTK